MGHTVLSQYLEEMIESEELWIRAAQRELRKGGNYQQLASEFGLHEDQKDVVGCKGRLEHSEMVHEAKETIIPPKNTDSQYYRFRSVALKFCTMV